MSERKTQPGGVTGAAAGTTDRSMPEAQSGSSAQPREALKIASGYAFTGSALDLGALMWGRRLSAGRAGQDPAAVAQPAGDVPGISEPGVQREGAGQGRGSASDVGRHRVSRRVPRPRRHRSRHSRAGNRHQFRAGAAVQGASASGPSWQYGPEEAVAPPPPEDQPRFSALNGGCFFVLCGFGALRAASARSRARRIAYGSLGMTVFLA